MNEKPEIKVGKLPVITKFIYTLGVLPTSYLMSMTYQEQVTWLYNYIQTKVIPLLNTESGAIQELQTLYELLRTYVNENIENIENYVNDFFDNLDVQEEINNKLNEMTEDGTIEELITQIVNVNEKLYYYVEDYGAKGDGVNDDSVAINNAFLDAKNKKGTVAFKTQNVYKIDSPIYIPQGCSLYGNGCTIISNCESGEYAIYVNSNSEDTNLETVGRSFSILRHFNLESANADFIENYNGIHFACHGIVQYVQFYKIDKCVRFSHPLYVDKFKIEFCNASTRTLSSNFAFDLGENGDCHEINNVQHSNTGSTAEAQPNFIHVGSYILNSKISNIIGLGVIDIKGECELENIMLSYYGKINVETKHKNITIRNVYASIDYLRAGRIHSKNNHILNLYNCRFISNYPQTGEIDNIGNPITFEVTDHVYVHQCSIGSRISKHDPNYSSFSYSELYGEDLVNPTIKSKNPNFNISLNTFNGNTNINGELNGTFVYTQKIIYDKDRLIGKSTTRTNTFSPSNKGVLLSNNSIDVPIYIERQAENNDKVSAYLYLTNTSLYDQGNNISSIPWSSNLIDTTLLNTKFSKIEYIDSNVIAYLDDDFTTPNGTWTKNDIIIANDGIKRFDGTNWI